MTNPLDTARDLIHDIQAQLQQIYAVTPNLEGSNGIIEASINRCHSEFAQAADKLNYPALRIATIGTTSAGKSTLVNALVGRKIAPMDAAELSAGVLHLVHKDRSRLHIKAVPNLWGEVDHYDLPDDDIYWHIREKVFKVYHEQKKKQTIPIPEIRIEGPLLPATWSELLALPDQISIELYDLPGLNSIADVDNLKVIQNHLKQCFSLIAMDYGHTDHTSRTQLLREIKEVVSALDNKTDAMLFVLNRVDLRGENDDPLEERIRDCAMDIQNTLGLVSAPTILPITSLPLFYAQCAWGYSAPGQENAPGTPTTETSLQEELLRQFQKDCPKFIKRHQKENPNIKNWFRDIEDALEDSTTIPSNLLTPSQLQQWIMWSWQHSGGLTLWNELRQRVQKNFAEIIIAPTLIQPLLSLETLLSMLASYSQTQRLSDKDAVEKQKHDLEQKFTDLESFLAQEGDDFEKKIKTVINEISLAVQSTENIEAKISKVFNSLFGIGMDDPEPEAIEKLRTIVNEIEDDLTDSIIGPMRDYYIEEFTDDDLKAKLNKILPAEKCNAIVHSASRYGKRFMGDAVKNGLDLKARKDDKSAIDHLKLTEDRAKAVFQAVRNGLTYRASYVMQKRDHAIQELMLSLREHGINAIEQRIRAELPEAADTLLAIYRQHLAEIEFEPLPDNIFALNGVDANDIKIAHTYEEGSCFKQQHTEYVDYIGLQLPSAEKMADTWLEGVHNAEAALWQAIATWLSQSARTQNYLFKQSVQETQAHLTQLLNQRLAQSEEEYKRRLAELNGLDRLCLQINANKNKVKIASSSVNP